MAKKTRFVLLMAIAIILLQGLDAAAIVIGPGKLEVSLPPGEIAVADYYVQNDTDSEMHVSVEPENWAHEAYDYGDLSIDDWVKMDCYEFDLKPNEIKKIKLTIRVPKNVRGELVAQIFFSSIVRGTEDVGGGIKTKLGGVLYVAIKGTENATCRIQDITISDFDEDARRLKFGIALINEGNVHIKPYSTRVLIEDLRGQKVGELTPVTDTSTLPGQEYTYEAFWDNPELKEGKYNVATTMKYGKIYGREKEVKFEKKFEVDSAGKVIVK